MPMVYKLFMGHIAYIVHYHPERINKRGRKIREEILSFVPEEWRNHDIPSFVMGVSDLQGLLEFAKIRREQKEEE